jgi:hypothetical protein
MGTAILDVGSKRFEFNGVQSPGTFRYTITYVPTFALIQKGLLLCLSLILFCNEY